MKFKIGDRVRINVQDKGDVDGLDLIGDMYHFHDCVTVVEDITGQGYYQLADIDYSWVDDWLSRVEYQSQQEIDNAIETLLAGD